MKVKAPTLTGEQIKELKKHVRYVRFVHSEDEFILQGTEKIDFQNKEKTEWKTIDIPLQEENPRSIIKLYEYQIIDLQEY